MDHVAIIGLGLIGGSLASALRRHGIHVTAYDQNHNSLEQGLSQGIIDNAADSVASAIDQADIVLLSVPVLSVEGILQEVKATNYAGIMTDVGSVKAPVLKAFRSVFGEVPDRFVPGHPIAGSEKHGVSAANPDLFVNHRVLLTPLDHTEPEATKAVANLWQQVGALVSEMTVEHHDSILAQTSHLPHLLAFGLIDTLSKQGDRLEIFEYAAGGLRDFSRIAASDPTMWRDIFLSNRPALLSILEQFSKDLDGLRDAIASDDANELFERLERSKAARDHFSEILEQRNHRRNQQPNQSDNTSGEPK